MMKHRLAKKRAADRDAVKAAGQLAVLPGFDGMSVAELMKPGVTFDDLVVDPGLGPLRAFPHHFGKGSVDPDLESSSCERCRSSVCGT